MNLNFTKMFFNLISRFNDKVRSNVSKGLKPNRELFVAEDYINNKVDKSDLFNVDLNLPYLNQLKHDDPSSFNLILDFLI